MRDVNHSNAVLTMRERETMTLVAQGKTYLEISKLLSLSTETIKTHVQKACRKLGATNRMHAIAIAVNHKLLSLEPSPLGGIPKTICSGVLKCRCNREKTDHSNQPDFINSGEDREQK